MKSVHMPKMFWVLNGTLGFILLPIAHAWAMGSPKGGEEQGPAGTLGLFAPMILVFLIFYFLLIRPQAKQQKKQKALIKGIQRGDEVVTAAGIHGKITSVTEETVGIEIAENVRIRVDKKQISRVKGQEMPGSAKKK